MEGLPSRAKIGRKTIRGGTGYIGNAIHTRNARPWMEKSQQNHLVYLPWPLTPDSPTSCDGFARATIKRPRNWSNASSP